MGDHRVPPKPDWRDQASYDYTRTLPRIGWAWEFFRRNPALRRMEEDLRQLAEVSVVTPRFRIVRLTARPRLWSLTAACFFDRLDQNALEAEVFWQPEACPLVLPAQARPFRAARAADRLPLPHPTWRTSVLITPDQVEHVLFSADGRAVQIACRGASVLAGDTVLTYAIEGFCGIDARIATLRRLQALHGAARPAHDLFKPEPRGRRLQIVLQALDGWRAGAPYREIAARLFGAEQAAASWSDPGDHLRDRTRRSIRRGRALMADGYRRLLL